MLCVNTYSKQYIAQTRSRVEAELTIHQRLRTAVNGKAQADLDTLEPLWLNSLIVVLDRAFVHRTRAIEKKDGNPLNEVRMLCNSILENGGRLAADKTIKYDPAKSVLKLPIGHEIKLTASAFQKLMDAFFSDLEAKFLAAS